MGGKFVNGLFDSMLFDLFNSFFFATLLRMYATFLVDFAMLASLSFSDAFLFSY